MLEKYYEDLRKRENLREALQSLRGQAKDSLRRQELAAMAGDGTLLIGLLSEEDPKVRKNAALLIGDLALSQAAEPLLTAYYRETTLFVKSAYLTALGKLDVSRYLDSFRTRMKELSEMTPAEDEKKHISEEIRELGKIITKIEGTQKHVFTGFQKPRVVVLATGHDRRDVTLREVEGLPARTIKKAAAHPLGVIVSAVELKPLLDLRTYRELLFPLHTRQPVTRVPEQAAEEIWNSELWELLRECHSEEAPFCFRLELRGKLEPTEKASFIKKLAARLEAESGRRLINSTGDYEAELRLYLNKQGNFVPFLKLYTIPMPRFSYRKNAVAMSIHPSAAAMLIRLAQPYLKRGARVLDPFCGVGTMLIEREMLVPAAEKYGIDIFGEAVKLGRENAAAAGVQIRFIQRDYFDFTYDGQFDEILTNLPVRGKQSKEEMDAFYAAFFKKSKRLLAPGGVLIFYSNEEGFVKKQLRLHTGYRLLQQFEVQEKNHFCLYVVGMKG